MAKSPPPAKRPVLDKLASDNQFVIGCILFECLISLVHIIFDHVITQSVNLMPNKPPSSVASVSRVGTIN